MSFVTLGTFDALHRGHKYLLTLLEREAKRYGFKSTALYFNTPPKLLLTKNTTGNILTLPHEKRKLIISTGVDKAVKINFNRQFARMSCEKFFQDTLMKKYAMKGLIVGKDFAFGHNRSGHMDFLRHQCAKYAIPLTVVSFVCAYGHKISSSVLRQILSKGEIEKVNNMLGRHYSASGIVIKEKQLGRKLGFPTANLKVNPDKMLPKGVFAVKVHLSDGIYNGVCNIGHRPTIENIQHKHLATEIHILDFDKTIYGKTITFEFLWKIRNEKKFKSIDELKSQISRDVLKARKKFSFFK